MSSTVCGAIAWLCGIAPGAIGVTMLIWRSLDGGSHWPLRGYAA
jgi:hypothetical protein